MSLSESFTLEQKSLLESYVTNTDRSVFVLTNLPEVIKGALFSRYSRSTLGLRTLLLKEFILSEDAEFSCIQGNSGQPQTEKVRNSRSSVQGSFMIESLTVTVTIQSESLEGRILRWKTFRCSPPCLLYTSPSPRDLSTSRMPSSA